LSSEGLVGDRTSFVIVLFFNVMKGPYAAAVSTGGSAAIGVASGTHRVVGGACPMSLLGRGTRSVMFANVVAVRPEKTCDRGWEECVVLWDVSTPLGHFSTLVATVIWPTKDMGVGDLPWFRGCVTFAYGTMSAGAGESIPGANSLRILWVRSETMP